MKPARRIPLSLLTALALGLASVFFLIRTVKQELPAPVESQRSLRSETDPPPAQNSPVALQTPAVATAEVFHNPSPPEAILDMSVQSRDGQAIPGATVEAQFRWHFAQPLSATTNLTTDKNGAARLAYPSNDLELLYLTVSHEEFASRKVRWDLMAGESVPAAYVIKLGQAIIIGGVVLDDVGSPISGVKLSFHRYWRGGERFEAKGEQTDFASRDAVTDIQGAWHLQEVPPELLDHIGFNVDHPDYLKTNISFRATASEQAQLKTATYKLVLHRGIEVRGLVLDPQSAPVPQATVWAGRLYSQERQQTKTDEDGRFHFQNVAQGDVPFSVTVTSAAPLAKTFNVHPGMDEIVLRLQPGKIIRGIVQNESNEPISGARVQFEHMGFQGGDGYEFSTQTRDDGRFEWNGAPDEDNLQFYFHKEGYAQLHNKALKPDIENVVILSRPRQIDCYVLDANSGQAIVKFKAAAGRSFGDNFWADGADLRDYSDAKGHFALHLDDEQTDSVRVQAEDYTPETQRIPKGQSGAIQMDFRLKPSPALAGTVLAPDGSPVAGAQVVFVKGGPGNYSAQFRRGRLEGHGVGQARIVTADSAGQFKLDSPPESGGTIVAVGEPGFGRATVEQLRASGVVMLQPYGQIEGTLKIGGTPAAGRELYFTLTDLGLNTQFEDFKTETDDQGQFKFDKVPPGEGNLVRLIQTTPNSWMHSHGTTVTVTPGQTTYITLGDQGALLRGRVRLQQPPPDGERLTLGGMLHSVMPSPQFDSPEESQAYYNSAEGRATVKTMKNFAIAPGPDGSFEVDSVPPGIYSLRLSASREGVHPWSSTTSAEFTTTLTVPDGASPLAPIDLGEITLVPVSGSQ